MIKGDYRVINVADSYAVNLNVSGVIFFLYVFHLVISSLLRITRLSAVSQT